TISSPSFRNSRCYMSTISCANILHQYFIQMASLESSVISVFKQPLLLCALIWHIWWGCRGDTGHPLGVGARRPHPHLWGRPGGARVPSDAPSRPPQKEYSVSM